MTKQERARQIDAEEFRRDSKQALARALAYSKQVRKAEAALIKSIVIHTPTMEENRRALSAKVGRVAKLHEHNGLALTVTQWAGKLGVTDHTFSRRVSQHGIESAVAMGVRGKSGPVARATPAKPKSVAPVKVEKPPRSKPTTKPKPTPIPAKLYTHDGVSLTVKGWAERFGVTPSALHKRASRFGSMEAAITMNMSERNLTPRHEHNGLSLTLQEWADSIGVKYHSFISRVHRKGLAAAIEQGSRNTRRGVGKNLSPIEGTDAGEHRTRDPENKFFKGSRNRMSIISLALFKAHINSDEMVDPGALGDLAAGTDDLLQLYIDAAEAEAETTMGKALADFSPVPADIKRAILQLAAHTYANREAVIVGAAINEIPHGVADTFRAHRIEVTGRVRT